MNTKKNVKEWIMNAPEYIIQRSQVMVNLHLNEVPYDIPVTLKQEIFKRLERMHWNLYPEWRNQRIHKYFANHLNVSPENLAIGKGMTLLLRSLFDLLINPFDSLLILNPEYEYINTLAEMYQLETTALSFERNFNYPIDDIVDNLKNNSFDLVYFSNPNNPTGAMLNPSKLKKILSVTKCPVIIDECYAPFAENNMQPLLSEHSNLVIIRSLASEYGVASARLGYILADNEIISGLKKILSPFLLDVFSEVIVTVLIEYREQLFLRTQRIKQIREFVLKKLREMEILTTYPSQGNYIVIQFPFNANDVRDWYLEKNILVKSLGHYPDLAQMIRVTISDEESMKIFLKATIEIIKEKMKDFY